MRTSLSSTSNSAINYRAKNKNGSNKPIDRINEIKYIKFGDELSPSTSRVLDLPEEPPKDSLLSELQESSVQHFRDTIEIKNAIQKIESLKKELSLQIEESELFHEKYDNLAHELEATNKASETTNRELLAQVDYLKAKNTHHKETIERLIREQVKYKMLAEVSDKASKSLIKNCESTLNSNYKTLRHLSIQNHEQAKQIAEHSKTKSSETEKELCTETEKEVCSETEKEVCSDSEKILSAGIEKEFCTDTKTA